MLTKEVRTGHEIKDLMLLTYLSHLHGILTRYTRLLSSKKADTCKPIILEQKVAPWLYY